MGEAEQWHMLPWALPGGRTLFTARKRACSWGDEEVVAQTLATGERKVLLRDAADARFLPTGHLLFLRRGLLFAVRFDPERLQMAGKEVPVVEPVAQSLALATGAGQYAVSQTGTLAWAARPAVPFPDATLATVDLQGRVSVLPAPVRSYAGHVRLSGDGRHLAVAIATLSEMRIWVYDLDRGTLTSLNCDGECQRPVWSNDGQRIFFRLAKGGRMFVATQVVDGSSPAAIMVNDHMLPASLSADGRTVLGVRGPLGDIYTLNIDDPAEPQPLIATPAREQHPDLSRDGRWLAFAADTSGRYEVFVRPYPGTGPTEQVSIEGGSVPCWRPDGRGLFFVGLPDASNRRRMMAVEFTPGPRPRIGHPRVLFEFDASALLFDTDYVRGYDITPDGQRFHVVQTRPDAPPPP